MIDGNWMGNNWIHIRGWEAHGQARDDGGRWPLCVGLLAGGRGLHCDEDHGEIWRGGRARK